MAAGKVSFETIIQSWYQAAFNKRPWNDALRATAEALGGAGAAYFDLNRSSGRIGQFEVHQLERGAGEYVERMNRINPRMLYSLRRGGPHVVRDYQILPEPLLRRDEFYDWMEKTNGTRYFVGARILDQGNRSLFASVEFSKRHGHADEDAVGVFRSLIPHIANAWQIAELTREVDQSGRMFEQLVANMRRGVVALRADGTILFMNRAAEQAIAAGDGLAVVDRRLRAVRAACDRLLQFRIAMATKIVDFEAATGAIAVSRPSNRPPYMLRVVHCGEQDSLNGDRLPVAFVLLSDTDSRDIPDNDSLQALGLSRAEMRIAQQIAHGRTLAEAARELGLAHNTARAHLRSIFAKTRARSQVELVRILGALAQLDGSGQP